jgi:hypothetical protein
MGPFLMSLEKVLAYEGGGPQRAYVTAKWAGTSMTEFMSLAFILAEKPCRAGIEKR